MRYIFAIVLPPLALLICRKPVQFVINLVFWILSIPLLFFFGAGFFVWLLCSVHALVICGRSDADRRLDRLTAAIATRNAEAPSAKA